MKVLLISHNYSLAQYAAKNILKLSPCNWTHVDRDWRLRGLERGTTVHQVIADRYEASYSEKEELGKILLLCAYRDFKIVKVRLP